jgi:hypothetical protein
MPAGTAAAKIGGNISNPLALAMRRTLPIRPSPPRRLAVPTRNAPITSKLPFICQTEDLVPIALHFATKGNILSRACRIARAFPRLRRRAIVLRRHGTIVIMEACKLSSRRRVEWTDCAALPTPGIVG